MEKSKTIKNKIIIGIIVLSVLAAAFFLGGKNIQSQQVMQTDNTVSEESLNEREVSHISASSEVQERSKTEQSAKYESKCPEEDSSTESTDASKDSEQSDTNSSISTINSDVVTVNSKEEISNDDSSAFTSEITHNEEASVYEQTSHSYVTEKNTLPEVVVSQQKNESSTEIIYNKKTEILPSDKQESKKTEKETSKENKKETKKESDPESTKTKPEKKNDAKVTETEKKQQISEHDYEFSCSLYISCETAIRNKNLSKSKRSVLPSDGIVLNKAEYGFDKDESVFDVLKRVCNEKNIHFDFTSVPVTGGAYIRGINNLYEYDCGSVSGWMYKVNGDFPNVGCSDYKLSEGDSIEFLYSCDLGADIGNIYLGD